MSYKFDLVIYCASLCFLGHLYGLVEQSKVEIEDIIATEDVLRDSINELFSSINFKPQGNSRLKEFSTIHNYFVSVTLQNYNSLYEIARLTRVDRKEFNNNTNEIFTTALDDLLNDDDGYNANISFVEENDLKLEYLTQEFLVKLKVLKDAYGVNEALLDINTNLLKYFKDADNLLLRKDFNNSNTQSSDNETIISSNEFWEPSGRRVYKGRRTKIKYFPFVASVHIFNTFQCAGSIIKSDLIVTASSCLQLAWNNRFYRENPAFVSVRVGSSFYDGGGEDVAVIEIYFHPDYDPKTLKNNICLLRLVRHLRFRKKNRRKIKKIDIDRNPWNLPETTSGVTILGWGAKNVGNILGNAWSNILSYAILDVYPLKECQEVYTREYVTKKNFCAGFFSKGGGACNHDVGAPGVVHGTLMGIVSFGSPICGAADAPTVFTKLGHYSDWIEQIMEMDVPHSKKRTTLKMYSDQFGRFITNPPEVHTTFKVRPIDPDKPMNLALYDDSPLKSFNDNLFDEFVQTMFDSEEMNNFKGGREGKNVLEQKDSSQILRDQTPFVIENTTVSNREHQPYIPLTVAYNSELEESDSITKHHTEDYKSVTRFPLTDDDDSTTEEYVSDTKLASNSEATHHSMSPLRKISSKPNFTLSKEHTSVTTLNTNPSTPEIFLELATEVYSDDSVSSEQYDIANKESVPINESMEISSSNDIEKIPDQQAIAELLDEIDLNKIIKEVKNTTVEFTPKAPIKTAAMKKIGPFNNINKQNDKITSIKTPEQGKDGKDSLLTVLYLTDNEKISKPNSANGKITNNKYKHDIPSKPKMSSQNYPSLRDGCKNCSNESVPKTKLYQILSHLLKSAISNKNND